jgi:hypothetical protein
MARAEIIQTDPVSETVEVVSKVVEMAVMAFILCFLGLGNLDAS